VRDGMNAAGRGGHAWLAGEGGQSVPLGGGYRRRMCPGGAGARLPPILPPVMSAQRAGDAHACPQARWQAGWGGLFLPTVRTGHCCPAWASPGPARAEGPGHAWGTRRFDGGWPGGFGALVR